MDCRQNQRRRYRSTLIKQGQEQLLQNLKQIDGVTSVRLNNNGPYSRNYDGEIMDIYYISLVQADVGIQNKIFRVCRTIYQSTLNGSTLEVYVPHASYVYAQNTLLSRLKENRYASIEALLCFVFILLILKLVLY